MLESYVQAIRRVDPQVQIIVDGQPAELAATIHRRLGDQIAMYAVHHYQPWRISDVRRDGQAVALRDLTEQDIWYAWVTVPRVDRAGQSVLMRGELNQARQLGYPVAMTEWNWNGWWGQPVSQQIQPAPLFTKGVGAAGMLHAIMRQGDVVRIGAQSMLIGDRWGIHAIYCDRDGATPPYMVPSGQVTTLYGWHHGNQRLKVELTGVPTYRQPLGMGGIGPAENVAYLDVLATRDDRTLYVHAINRHFDQPLSVHIDLTAVAQQPGLTGIVHSLEEATPGSHPSPQPGVIRATEFRPGGGHCQVRLAARSVNVIEIPLQSK